MKAVCLINSTGFMKKKKNKKNRIINNIHFSTAMCTHVN